MLMKPTLVVTLDADTAAWLSAWVRQRPDGDVSELINHVLRQWSQRGLPASAHPGRRSNSPTERVAQTQDREG